jgi:hypothetical protein
LPCELLAGRVVMRREGRFLRGWFGHRSTLPARHHAANRQELARWRVCRRRKERSVIRSGLRRLWGAPVWNWRDAFHLFFPFRSSPLAGPLTNMVAIPFARHTKPAQCDVSCRTRPAASISTMAPSGILKSTSGVQLQRPPRRMPQPLRWTIDACEYAVQGHSRCARSIRVMNSRGTCRCALVFSWMR